MYGQNLWQPYGGSSHNAVSPAFVMVDGAVVKAHSDLLATGESISAWSVANAALLMLNAISFESLGFNMQSIPSLNRLMLNEVKVNSFIHCFAGVQNITSVRDLEMAICEREGVTNFEELGLGPILKHPLVLHYFSSQIATASQTSTAAQMRPDRVAPLEGKQGSKIKLS
ncbi:hypothetical protein HanPSC8_Chr11g0462341 [Helianthus annuus]|nr:hypothetical protein HanIR_Chr11g0516771 [Helianthus annuus]KAJ0874285.1 hypothetical protein HanPSC8_Chr11g0462341 [Helianthus annuus]